MACSTVSYSGVHAVYNAACSSILYTWRAGFVPRAAPGSQLNYLMVITVAHSSAMV